MIASQPLDNQPLLLESRLSRVSKPNSTMLIPKMSSFRSSVSVLQKEGFLVSWRVLVDFRLDFFAVERFDLVVGFFAFLAGIILDRFAVFCRGL